MARVYEVIGKYDAPGDGVPETPEQLDRRISLTLDEAPDVHSWLLHLHSYFAHWTSGYDQTHGRGSDEYKDMIIRRDAIKNAASAIKLRYEATSRRLTQIMAAADEAKLPRGR